MSGHIRQRSPGSWELRYPAPRDPGGKRRTATTTFRGTKRQAEAKLRELMTAVDRGEHVEPSKSTVAAFVQERVAQWQDSGSISNRTAEHYGELAALIIAHLGDVGLQKLTTLQVERWHAQLRTNGLGANTVRHAHNLLGKALGDAVRHNLLSRNVAHEQKPPKVERTEVEILAPDQIAPMLAKLKHDPLYPAVIVGLYCGLRRSEQLALRWCNVDLDAKTLRVREALDETKAGIAVKQPKTKAGRRTISLPDVVITALREHRRRQLEQRLLLGQGRPDDSALVFPADDGGQLSPRAFSMRWRRTVRRLGLPAGHWHSLRHTHASMLIAAGIDVVMVSKRLGHADPRITLGVYSHLFAKDDTAAAAAINAALG